MPDLPLTLGDLIVIGVLLISGLLAFVRGFVQEVLDVVAWIGAIVAAVYAYPMVAPMLDGFVDDRRIANVAAGVGVFVVAIVVLSLATRLLSKSVRSVGLGPLDRSLGFVFGLARGALLVVLAYLAVDFLVKPADQPDWLTNARTRDVVASGAEFVRSLVPGDTTQDAAAPASDPAEAVRKALEIEKLYEDMVSPDPKGGSGSDAAPARGYGDEERRDMQRLLDSTGAR